MAEPPISRPVKLEWVTGTRKQMNSMPDEIQDVFGSALLDVEYGDVPDGARPYGEGLPKEIMKLVEDFDGDTYRAAYTVAFPGVAYVLDVFQKKSTKGKATPKVDKERVKRRYQAAKEHYMKTYRDPKERGRGRSL